MIAIQKFWKQTYNRHIGGFSLKKFKLFPIYFDEL